MHLYNLPGGFNNLVYRPKMRIAGNGNSAAAIEVPAVVVNGFHYYTQKDIFCTAGE